jgi:hypothetical protein
MMNTNPSKNKPKKLFDPSNREELLRGWLLHAHKGRDRHDVAARRDDKYRYWLGVPAIILSTIVGTAIFASLEAKEVGSSITIIVGLVSILSAVLGSLQTFYNFASKSESHQIAGVKYKMIIRELEQILSQPVESLPIKADYLDDLRKKLDDLEVEAPVVSEGIYNQIEERYANADFVDNVDSLIRRVKK